MSTHAESPDVETPRVRVLRIVSPLIDLGLLVAAGALAMAVLAPTPSVAALSDPQGTTSIAAADTPAPNVTKIKPEATRALGNRPLAATRPGGTFVQIRNRGLLSYWGRCGGTIIIDPRGMSSIQASAVREAVAVFAATTGRSWKVSPGRGHRFVDGAITIATRPSTNDGVYGTTWSTVSGDELLSSKIVLSREMGQTPAYWAHVTLHELGHAVGVEHSDDPANVTYPNVRNNALWLRYSAAEASGLRMLTRHSC